MKGEGKSGREFAAGDLATRIPQSVDHSRRVELSQCIMEEIQSLRNHVLLHEKLISGGRDLSLAFNTRHRAAPLEAKDPNFSNRPESSEINSQICRGYSFTCLL